MLKTLQLRLKPEVAYDDLRLRIEISTLLDIDVNRIRRVDVTRRSIDARQRQVMVNLSVAVHIDTIDDTVSIAHPVEYAPVPADAQQAVVVGAGPAGLFAALRLIQSGIRPIVVERGKNVDDRRPDMAKISREGIVDPDSNYCFGEGGAGAFSDGKLYTRSKKRGSVDKVLNILHQHGASENILVDAHPHIGSDKLPAVIKSIRQTIERCGGKVFFGERVTALIHDGARVSGVVTALGNRYDGPVILATGHSARDVYNYLHSAGITVQPKGLAVGVRLEHQQADIDKIFYHSPKGRGKYLPPAEYSLLTRIDGRAVYSFCMCPGGYIIPAASAPGQIVVNGMSPSNRGTRWANSGMVVEILPEDVPGDNPLKMMEMQEEIERRFFDDATAYAHQTCASISAANAAQPSANIGSVAGSQNAPAQRMTDFVAGRPSKDLPPTSYTAGIHLARVDRLLPKGVSSRLKEGFKEFGRKHRGFLTDSAVVIGDETRTSSPVRIPRDTDTLQHITFAGLYPCGEGAGYAGGIVSAAIDGDRCAEALALNLK